MVLVCGWDGNRPTFRPDVEDLGNVDRVTLLLERRHLEELEELEAPEGPEAQVEAEETAGPETPGEADGETTEAPDIPRPS